MGYNLPTENYLFYKPSTGQYILNITIIANFDIGVSIDEAEIHIILPEGASNFHVVGAPYAIESSTGSHMTYLDIFGRPVLILKKNNVVNEHHQYFQIAYNFSQVSMLLEPFLLVGGYSVILISLIIIRRFDLSINE